MGQRAIRSQMDVRIAFRMQERGDADLIFGRGKRNAGWHADTLNAPGKFLISAAEHDVPRRARAYLLTDEMVSATAARHAMDRPELDEISAQVIAGRPQDDTGQPADGPSSMHDFRYDDDGTLSAPEVMLWAALVAAPPEGITVAGLMTETGVGRRWVYYRLKDSPTKAGSHGRNRQTSPLPSARPGPTRGRWG
jgi:hypothetical protein